MTYFEVAIADRRYRGDAPLTYSSESELAPLSVVAVPLQNRMVTGFVIKKAKKPLFKVKPVKNVLSRVPLPKHCFKLAGWLEEYYACNLGEALRQFAPTKPTLRRPAEEAHQSIAESPAIQLDLISPLTKDQAAAIKMIEKSDKTTQLLHGDTGTGKTRVYLELAKAVLEAGRSVILLTPEIALTSQLAAAIEQHIPFPAYTLHSHLTASERKKIWLALLESSQPVLVLGPRSALFTPIKNIGLIIVDEAHEPAYKQEQTPRYQTTRVASQLGHLTGAKVIFGSATPLINDYYLAEQYGAIIRMTQPAVSTSSTPSQKILVDLKDRTQFTKNNHLSNILIDEISTTLSAKKQILIYLNRRGTARIVMCSICGWQLHCPHCDIPMVYHADTHSVRCHICGRTSQPPPVCPNCANPDINYRSIGTKALTESVSKLFPEARVSRFDSDNLAGERVNEVYQRLRAGEIDILIGTQLLAKGFDLPKLALVGIVSAETSLALPDFTAEERAFQLLYQVSGRVGRGHTPGKAVIQTYNPENVLIKAAIERDFTRFYKYALAQRKLYRFPPYSYLGQFVCRRASLLSAEKAATGLRNLFVKQQKKVEIIGPAPAFYAKRSGQYFWQLVVKSKNRRDLVELARSVPANWTTDLDPSNLL